MKLLENPAIFSRKRPTIVIVLIISRGFILSAKHRLMKKAKKGYCNIYRIIKERPAKRQAFAESDNFGNKRQKRGLES